MTPCQALESSMNKETENNVASSKEDGDGKDNCKVSDVHLPDIVKRKEKNKCEKEAEKAEQHSENTYPRRPHIMYAKFIRTNARFYNEPVGYIEHPNMRNQQTTQRSDFKIPACELILPNRHGRKQKAACGIVPLAISDTLPVIEKKITHHFPFIRQFRKSLPPKRHGAFLQTDIKQVRRPIVPRRTEVFHSAHLPVQSKTEKGNSMTSTETSPSLCQHRSQRSPISEYHLSETDIKEASKAYLPAPGKERKSARISRTAEVNFMLPTREEAFYPPMKQSF
ncbi:ciliary microtubule inner protein 6 isoform X2 [Notamacropus eugenii]|uniref:ciliary microtubule inner protein 6 isoform X2 n=1 Tax=Notamacropus eugenii TaxID=9315 RepID=UPI003B6703C8